MESESRRARREKRTQAAGVAEIPRRSLVLTGVLLCSAVALGSGATIAHRAADEQQVRNAAQIEAKTWELKVVQGAAVEERLDGLTGDLASARDLARQVAMEQTHFSTLLVEDERTGQGDSASSAADLDTANQGDRLARFFTPETLVADSDAAGTSASATDVRSDRIDPRRPWFRSTTSDWKVVAVTPSEHAGHVDVTWLSSDTETGDLYAWAQSRYVVERALFHELTIGVTTLGAEAAADSRKPG